MYSYNVIIPFEHIGTFYNFLCFQYAHFSAIFDIKTNFWINSSVKASKCISWLDMINMYSYPQILYVFMLWCSMKWVELSKRVREAWLFVNICLLTNSSDQNLYISCCKRSVLVRDVVVIKRNKSRCKNML